MTMTGVTTARSIRTGGWRREPTASARRRGRLPIVASVLALALAPVDARAQYVQPGGALEPNYGAGGGGLSGDRPRSVIPWLEQALEGDAEATMSGARALEPPLALAPMPDGDIAAAAPRGPNQPAQVEVAGIGQVRAAAAGVIAADEVGMPVDSWRGVGEQEAVELVARLRPTRLRTANWLAVRLLSVAFESPADTNFGADVDLLSARLDALRRYGAADTAARVAESAGAEAVIAAADMALVSGYERSLCRHLLDQRVGSPERIYCQGAAGDRSGASIAISASRALGQVDAEMLELLEAVADPQLAPYIAPPSDSRGLTALQLAALRRIGAPLPADFARSAPLELLQAALNDSAAPRQRLEALERLEASGAVETAELAAAFANTPSAESGGVWGRVEAYRQALLADSRAAREAIETAMARAREADRESTMARLLAEEVARRAIQVSGRPDPNYVTPQSRRLLQLGGHGEIARQLVGEGGRAALGPEDRAVDRVAAASAAANWDATDAEPLVARAVRGDQAAGALLAGLRAMGADANDPTRYAALDDLSFRLSEGRAAQVAFEALAALSERDEPAPEDLYGALKRLQALGFEVEARQIAVEAALLAE